MTETPSQDAKPAGADLARHQISITAREWRGILPSPEDLARFKEIVPDGAERLFAMAEEEQKHRQVYEVKALTAATSEARYGQIFGAVISFFSIAASLTSALFGAHWSVSVALVGVPLMALTKAIVDSRSAR